MLPRPLRVTTAADHRMIARRGRRAGTSRLVVHLLLLPEGAVRPGLDDHTDPHARAGVVVGRPVGNAVVRHRVARRLRHLLRARLGDLPVGALVVVRARPGAGTAVPRALAADLDEALARVSRPGHHGGRR